MKKPLIFFCFGVGIFMFPPVGQAFDPIESEVLHTLKPVGHTVDTAMSKDGKFFFVLTGGGKIEIFEAGEAKGILQVPEGVSSIESNTRGDILFLSDTRENTIQIVAVQFIKHISTEGSPFKGPVDAPVEVVFFNDFQ